MNPFKSILRAGRKYKTGVILSGGGARGFAHAGILKALNEADIYPDVVSGVSAGAIVGAFYSDGYSPDEIFDIFSQEKKFFNYAKISIPKAGLFRTIGLEENLSKNLRAQTFEDLKIPLFIAATNMNEGRIEYFNSGELVDRIIASASIPVLFQPVEIKGTHYIDGGVIDNFPITPIMGDCRKIIGVSLNPIQSENNFNTIVHIAERAFRLSVSSNISPKISHCDLVFEPEELGKYGLLDVSKGQEMFDLGYQMASRKLESAKL